MRLATRRWLALAVAMLASLVVACPARALVQHVDGTPEAKPPDGVVGRWAQNGSAVAIGPNFIITARHQLGGQGSSVYFNGVEYKVGEVRTPNQDGLSNADIRVARIWTVDGKPANLEDFVSVQESQSEKGKTVTLGGFGKGRGSELKTPGGVTYAYQWAGADNHTQRWGANTILDYAYNVAAGSYVSNCLVMDFDGMYLDGWVANESAGALWDSGGGWFIYDAKASPHVWRAAALTAYTEHAEASWFRDSATGAEDPDWNWGIRVASYADWIKSHSDQWTILPGDANLDGKVDVGDLGVLGQYYGRTSGMTWQTCDFNGDGAVDVGDLGILGDNYGQNSPPPAPAGGLSQAVVLAPEPAGILLLIAGAVTAFRRRRRDR